jgi:hypothetical protein
VSALVVAKLYGTISGSLVLLAACSGDAEAQPSLIPSLKRLRPVIVCVDENSGENERLQCGKKIGISKDYRLPDEPKTPSDLTIQAVLTWAALTRGTGEKLSAQQFDEAIEFATCIEQATRTLRSLQSEGDPRNAIGAGHAKTQAACADQYFSSQSMASRHPGLLRGELKSIPVSELKAQLLATIFAGAAYRYVIEANGWVTDAMRPCVRYLDGRPPSAGCAYVRDRKPPVAPIPAPQ